MSEGVWHQLETETKKIVPVQLFKAEGAHQATLLMLPALGIAARFYRRLAAGLAAQGIQTIVFEQRGHGESPYRAKRGAKFGFDAFLEEDIPAALAFAKQLAENTPLYLGGHSLGGHFSSIIAGRHPDGIEGVVQIACGFPYHGLYAGPPAKKIRTLCRLLPPVCFLLGYFPGQKIGFGGREYRQLMLDWRDWALGGRYDYGKHTNIEGEIALFGGRVLSISFEKDFFASDEATEYSRTRLKGADQTALKLGRLEQGEHLGHFDWARKPDGVVETVSEWLKT
ncbi:alpha/beta fold hydrolase [Kordiimonas sp.]|uniref:alpha/beta hydrolase family protein n=1 Tax=Kordiimonas sp. TaxID=1970157 RepID=UPI003A8DA91D